MVGMAGFVEAALMSSGSSYTNESKTITANGEYMPNEGLRWNKVIVNVPDYKDEMEKYKKLYEIATDQTTPTDIPTDIPRDPNDPDNPNGDDRWIFENAIDIGENIDPNDFLPLLLKSGKTSGDIVDINSGLSISYVSESDPALITIKNLYNGKQSTRAFVASVGSYVGITGIDVRNTSVAGGATQFDSEGNALVGQGFTLYYSSIDFIPPADWKPYYIVV